VSYTRCRTPRSPSRRFQKIKLIKRTQLQCEFYCLSNRAVSFSAALSDVAKTKHIRYPSAVIRRTKNEGPVGRGVPQVNVKDFIGRCMACAESDYGTGQPGSYSGRQPIRDAKTSLEWPEIQVSKRAKFLTKLSTISAHNSHRFASRLTVRKSLKTIGFKGRRFIRQSGASNY
jgi:hypothetical protein